MFCKRGEALNQQELSALDAYINRVYRVIVLIVPGFCMGAAVFITFVEWQHWYPPIDPVLLAAFDLSTIVYMAIGIYFSRTGFGEDDIILPDKLKAAKKAIAAILIIQWNAVTFIWPFTDFWAFSLIFIICTAFFFDYVMTAIVSVGICLSLAASWIVGSNMLMPPFDRFFTFGIVLRLVGISLSVISVNVMVYLGGKFLVEELEKFVNYDTLTHLLNRRSMDGYLREAYLKAKAGKSTFCLMMLDIDDFKKVNDTHGHDCGDAVLRYVADTVSRGVRKKDNVFRWGGEEILILFNSDENRALEIAERIRRDIAAAPISYRNNVHVSVTATIGLAAYKNGANIQTMMDEADANLYYGKRHGKNQVVQSKMLQESAA